MLEEKTFVKPAHVLSGIAKGSDILQLLSFVFFQLKLKNFV